MRDSSICEPHFSFVQVHAPPEEQNRVNILFGQQIRQSDLPAIEINQYIHFCKFGSGHTGAYEKVSKQGEWRDNLKTDYETEWWNRSTRVDYSFRNEMPYMEGMYSAEEYSKRAVIGSLQKLRHFLEQSLKKTYRTDSYISHFILMLNDKGRDEFYKQAKRFNIDVWSNTRKVFRPTVNNDQVMKFVLGYTRKRRLLISEWADDDKLWVQKKELLIL